MAIRLSEIVGSFHAAVYPYCKSILGHVGALSLLIGVVYVSCRFYFGRSYTGRISPIAGAFLFLLHLLVSLDWLYSKLHWGEHPISVLLSLAVIDLGILLRTRRPSLVNHNAAFVVFVVAATLFTLTFGLCDLFPVFVTIGW